MHKWTNEDCEIVCSIFKKEFVDTYNNSVQDVITKIKNKCPLLNVGSIRMKISNTVYLCDEFGIEHNCSIAVLSNYSQQHLDAFQKVFDVSQNF